MIRTIPAILAVFLLTACGTPKIPAPDPTPLSDIHESVELKSRWSSNDVRVSSRKEQAFLSLRPSLESGLLIAASPEGEVFAFNSNSGSMVWTTELSENISAGTGAGDDIVVVVSDTGTAYGLDIRDGAKLWEYQLGELVFSPPLIYRNQVVLRTIDGNLIVLSAVSGEFLWDAIYDQPEFLEFGSAAPVGFQNVVIFGNALGRVIATDLTSGFEAWSVFLGSERSVGQLRSRESRPVLFQDHLILSDLSRAIVVYDLSTGNVLWESRLDAGRNTDADNNSVYGHSTDGLILAFDQTNGSPRWQQNALLYRGIDDLALVDGRLVVGDRLSYFHIFDQNSGEFIGRHRARERVASGGFLGSGNSLYVYYRSGHIEAFTLTSSN